MLFWFIAGILTLGVVLSIIWPILKEKTLSEDPASFNLQVYADQLDELERDLMQGRIGKNDKESARLEIQRRILSTSIDIKDKDKQTHKAPSQISDHIVYLGMLTFWDFCSGLLRSSLCNAIIKRLAGKARFSH